MNTSLLTTTCSPAKGINIERKIKSLEAKLRKVEAKFYAEPTLHLHEQIELLEEKIASYSFLLEFIAENAFTQAKLKELRATHILIDNSFLPIKQIRPDGVIVLYIEENECREKRIRYREIEGIKTLAEFCNELLPAAQATRPALIYTLANCIEVDFT